MDQLINSIGCKIADFFVNNNLIQNEKKDVYRYGVIVAIQSSINWITVVILGAIFGMFLENLCFFITYKILRKFSGGFHSSKFSICFTLSNFLNVLFLFIIQFLRLHSYYSVIMWFELFSFLIIIAYAPILNPNKQISNQERSIYKRISIGISLILLLVSICLIYYGCQYVFPIAMAISMNGILMITEVIKVRIINQTF